MRMAGRFTFSTRCNFSTHLNGLASHLTTFSKSAFFLSCQCIMIEFHLKRVTSFDFVQVSIRACEESRVMLWHRDKLKLILLSDPFMQAVFDQILGRDVVRKLIQVNSMLNIDINDVTFFTDSLPL